jgi:hypothetical protein
MFENIVWSSAEPGLCYQGCAFMYCNPLHVGIAAGVTMLLLFVFLKWVCAPIAVAQEHP